MSQYQFAKSAVGKFCLEEISPCNIPRDPAVFLSKSMSPQSAEQKGEMFNKPYREAVGTLPRLSFGTRPDICYAVSQSARYNNWRAVLRFIRYLKGTLKLGLRLMSMDTMDSMDTCNDFLKRFNSCNFLDFECVAYNNERRISDPDISEPTGNVDSNHGRCIDTRISVTCFIYYLLCRVICWQTKQQTTVALSSMGVEYMVTCVASQGAIWLVRLLKDFDCLFTKPISLMDYNQSCIYLFKNPGDFAKSQHIDTRYHFVRDQVEAGNLLLKKIDTK